MVGAGYLVGGADKSTQAVFALSAGLRNITAALVLAGSSFDHPAITVMMLVASVVSLVVLLVLAKVIGGESREHKNPWGDVAGAVEGR